MADDPVQPEQEVPESNGHHDHFDNISVGDDKNSPRENVQSS